MSRVCVLKFCLFDLLPVITKMINLSLETGTVEDVLKEALLVPLLKKVNSDFEVFRLFSTDFESNVYFQIN